MDPIIGMVITVIDWVGAYGLDGDPFGYLNPGDQPYFKLFDSDTDTLYFMLAYKDGEEIR